MPISTEQKIALRGWSLQTTITVVTKTHLMLEEVGSGLLKEGDTVVAAHLKADGKEYESKAAITKEALYDDNTGNLVMSVRIKCMGACYKSATKEDASGTTGEETV